MPCYIIEKNGERQNVSSLDGYEGWIEIGRSSSWPKEGQRWENGAWQTDAREVANARAGEAHIKEAHAIKYLEALLILSGVPLTKGLLYEEHLQHGILMVDLAKRVMAKRESFLASEMMRQAAQVKTKA